MAEISPELAARIEELRTKHEENPAKFFMSLANAYREAGQLAEAESLLREHLKRHPGYLSAHVLLGGCLADRGARDEARNEFHYVLSIDPQNLIALRTLGDMATGEGNREEARRWYNEWLAVDPMSAEARKALDAVESLPSAEASASWDPYGHGDVAEAAQETQAGAGDAGPPAAFGDVEIASHAAHDDATLPEGPAGAFGEVELDSSPPAAEISTPEGEFGEIEISASPADDAPEEPLDLPEWGEMTITEPAAAEADSAEEAPGADAPLEFGTIDLSEPVATPPAEPAGEWADWGAASGIDLPPLSGGDPEKDSLPAELPEAPLEPQFAAEDDESVGAFEIPAAPPGSDASGGVDDAFEPELAATGDFEMPAAAFAATGADSDSSVLDDLAADTVPEPEVTTETMAELLYGQGHLDRAADVYRELLMRGGDPAYSRRLAEIEAEMRGEKRPGDAPVAEESWDGRTAPADAASQPVWLEAMGAVASGVAAGLQPTSAAPAAGEPVVRRTVGQYLTSLLSWRPGAAATTPVEEVNAGSAASTPGFEDVPPTAAWTSTDEPTADEPPALIEAFEPATADEGTAAEGDLPWLESPAEPAGDTSVEVADLAMEPAPWEDSAADEPQSADAGAPPAEMPWDAQTLNAPEAQPPLDEPWMAEPASAGTPAPDAEPRDPFADSFSQGFGAEGAAPPAEGAPAAVAPETGASAPEASPVANDTEPAPPAEAPPAPWEAPQPEAPAEEMPWEAPSTPAAPGPEAPSGDPMPWEAPAAPAPEPEPAAPAPQGGGFSFEDFFSAPPAPAEPAPAPAPTPAPEPSAQAGAAPAAEGQGDDDEDLESFQAWLQSLKR